MLWAVGFLPPSVSSALHFQLSLGNEDILRNSIQQHASLLDSNVAGWVPSMSVFVTVVPADKCSNLIKSEDRRERLRKWSSECSMPVL